MCPSRNQSDLHVGNRRTGKHTSVLFFFQVRKNQTLPVFIQHILAAGREKLQTASTFPRLQQKMHLRIVPQGFEVTHAFHRCRNRFLINNISCSKLHCHMKAVPDQPFQNLNLYFPHQHGMNLRKLLVPHDMELWFFLLQLF